jgi:hypothetical protein
MSGIIVNNVARASGTIAATPGGLDWSTAVVTGSTVTVEAGKGYFINTTSNACTVTLPASADPGDQIVLADYARTWATNAVTLDSNGNNFQGEADTYTVDYDTAGQSLNIVYADSTKGWLPVSDDAVADVPVAPTTQLGVFAYGYNGSTQVNTKNLVNSSGVIAADVTGVGTARDGVSAATYGGDKGIFAYGSDDGSNLVSNTGVISADVSRVGSARANGAASTFGTSGQAIFAFGSSGKTNLVSNSGVVANDVNLVGTGRNGIAACRFGVGLAIFAFGESSGGSVNTRNLVNTSGVVASDATGAGTARQDLAAAAYGVGLGIFAFGSGMTNIKNLVNNVGVVASNGTGVGTARGTLAATDYGGDKAIFSFGSSHKSNLVSNTGVVAADVSGVGTSRASLAACGYSYSA